VHLVGFITRIFHDARSSECQIHKIKVLRHSNHLVMSPMTYKLAAAFIPYIVCVKTYVSLDTCAPKMCRRDGFRDVCLVLYCTARQDTFSVEVTSN